MILMMDYKQIFEKIQDTMRKVFKDQDMVIEENMSARDIKQWNSLSHVMIIAELEKTYKIKFGLTDMLDIRTVDDICRKVLQLKAES